jgi:hypothetical protein
MKKLLLPLALLALLVGFCCYTTWHVDQLCSDCAQLLEEAGQRCQLGDFEEGLALCNQAKQNWDHHEGFFGTALRHTESDDVGIAFPALLESCRQEDLEEFSRRDLELIAILRHLSRMEYPYYFNVL